MHKYKILWYFRDYQRLGRKATIILSKTLINPFIQELTRLSCFDVDLDPWELVLGSEIYVGDEITTVCPGDNKPISRSNVRAISTYICNKTCK